MNQNTLYYGNTGQGSTITRELIANIFGALSQNLRSNNFKDFVSKSRIPNERELYGIIVKSIIESCNKEHLGHIATEFQVERGEGSKDEGSKGRVDLFFDYRSVSYLVELKVGRVNARGDDREPKKRAKEIWHNAINQLDGLIIDSVECLLQGKKIVKLPIALYFYDTEKEPGDESERIEHESIHTNILNFIKTDADGKEKPKFDPDFYLYSEIPCIRTRLRKTHMSDDESNYLYGVSMFAKQL